MKKYLTKAILILSISPLSVLATAGVTDFSGLGTFIDNIKNNVIVNLSALFLTTAVVAFFYGVVKFIIDSRNGKTDGGGKDFMLWGLIALFAMFSVWGIVKFSQKVLGIDGQTTIDIPSIRFRDTGGAPGAGPSGSNVNAGASANVGSGAVNQNMVDTTGWGWTPNTAIVDTNCPTGQHFDTINTRACIPDVNPQSCVAPKTYNYFSNVCE